MGILILIYPFVEFYLLVKLVEAYSFTDVLLFIFASGLLGLTIMASAARSLTQNFQLASIDPQAAERKIMHRSLIFLGGLLIFLPGVLSDVVGAALVLPGSRHLIIMLFKHALKQALGSPRFSVFRMGRGSFGFGGNFGDFSTREPRFERDAEVIDVKAIDISEEKSR